MIMMISRNVTTVQSNYIVGWEVRAESICKTKEEKRRKEKKGLMPTNFVYIVVTIYRRLTKDCL